MTKHGTPEEHAARCRDRKEANTPWPPLDPAAPKPEPVRPLIISREEGPRIMVRAIIANAFLSNPRIAELCRDLTAVFGGYTAYQNAGGWRAENGAMMDEAGYVFEVSFHCDRPDRINTAVDLFAMAGRDIGERWIHVEQHCFNARHVQVNA